MNADLLELEDHIIRRLEGTKKWFHMTLSQLLTLGVVAVGAVYTLGIQQGDIQSNKRNISILEVKVQEMDSKGTIASRERTALDHQLIQQQETRVSMQDMRIQKLEDVGTRLAVIESRISQMQTDVKEIKDRP